MTRTEEIGRGLYAAWRFLRLDPEAAGFVRPRGRGVLLSFFAVVFAVPLYGFLVYLTGLDPNAAQFARIPIWLLMAGYLITWPLYALLMFHLLPLIDKGHFYLVFMPIYNWGRLLALFLRVPANILIAFRITSPAWDNVLLIGTAVLVLSYKTFIIRRTTGCSMFHAIVFVALDVLMVMTVEWSMRDAFAAA